MTFEGTFRDILSNLYGHNSSKVLDYLESFARQNNPNLADDSSHTTISDAKYDQIDAVQETMIDRNSISDLLLYLDEKGWTLLHHICYCDDSRCYDSVMSICETQQGHSSMKCEILSQKNLKGNTCIHILSQQNSLQVSRSLGKDEKLLDSLVECLDLRNNWDETALHLSAANGHKDMITVLLEYGAKKQSKDRWNRTPYIVAQEYGYGQDILDLLTYPNAMEDVAAYKRWTSDKNLDILRYDGDHAVPISLSNLEDISKVGDESDFYQRQKKITYEFMEKIGRKNAPASEENSTNASNNGTSIQVKHMFTTATDKIPLRGITSEETPDTSSSTTGKQSNSSNLIESHGIPRPGAIGMSSSNGTMKIPLSKLIEYPCDISRILSYIEKEGDKYDISGRDMFGLTALHKAASWNYVPIIDALLSHLSSDEINAINKATGYSALHYSVDECAELSVRRLLQDERVQLHPQDKKGRTARDIAVEKRFTNIVAIFDNN